MALTTVNPAMIGQTSTGAASLTATGSAAASLVTAAGTALSADSSGRVTTPFQPAFSAFRDAGSVTGNNATPTVIVFNNATFANVGSHYSTSTGRFTAPVAGVYYFSFIGMLDSTPNTAGDLQLAIRKNGTNLSISNPPQVGASIQGMGFAASANVTLAASDYVDVVFYASNNSSRLYAAGGAFNNFSGFLIG